MNAFVKIKREYNDMKLGLNLFYATIGVVEDVHWREVARREKGRLLMELESLEELTKNLHEDDSSGKPY